MRSILSILIVVLTVFLQSPLLSQITSFAENDPGSAIFDIQSTKKGLLIPRMTVSQRDAIASPADGLMVFVTSDSSFYYFNGNNWTRFDQQQLTLENNNLSLSDGGSVDLSGYLNADNLGNHQATQNIQLNNQWISNDGDNEGLQIDNEGRIGIGTDQPTATLDVNGNVRIQNGSQGSGKVLTSDATGNATWESLSIPDSVEIMKAAGFPDSVLYKTTIFNHSFSIEVQGQYAYLSRIDGNSSQFDVYDISDPGNIIHKITVGDLGTFPKDIHVDGNLAALINSGELYFINITNPAVATRFPPFPYVTSTFQKTTIRFNGAYLFTLSQGSAGLTGQLEITPNLSSNANTLGLVEIGENPADIDFQNNYAFVVNDGNDSLEIIDYSNPATASVVHGLLLSSNPKSISISGNYAYVTDNSNQLLHVIDITNPLNASLVSSINVGISPTQIRTTENYAFLLGSTGEFLIVDITNPFAPKTARTVYTGGTSSGAFDIESDYAYVSISTNGDYSIQTIPIPKETSFIPIYDCNGSVTEYSIAEKLNAAIDTFKLSGNLLQLSLSRDMESVKEVDLSTYLDNTDAQSLSLNANTISLTNGGSVDLSGFKDNTDDQRVDVFQLNGDNLELSLESDQEATKSIDLSGFKDNTDDQRVDVFQLNGDNLELSLESDQEATKSIDLSSFKDNTDAQTLSLSGDSLSLANGGYVKLSSFLDNTDAQILSLSGNNLSLSGGNSVDLSAFMDADNLGNHQATQNVQLKNQWLSNDGGNEGLRIDNNGQIGIGIPTPLAKLHLFDGNQILQRSNNANNTDILFRNSGGFYNWRISHLAGDGNDDLIIAGGNSDTDPSSLTERLRFDENGNIGIGISDPGEKLHVEGSIRMVDGNQSAGYIPVSDANGSMQWTNPATLGVGQWTVSGNDISQANSGTVGIASLTVKNASTGTNALQFHAGQDTAVWINYKGEGNGYAGNIYSYNDNDHFFVFNNNGSLRMNYSNEVSDNPDQSNSSNFFTLKSNGRVGIGTSNPDSKLEIAGTTTGITGGIEITQGSHSSSIYHSASGDLILSKAGAAMV